MYLRAAAANLGSVDAWAQLGTAQISLGRARCEDFVGFRCEVPILQTCEQERTLMPQC